MDPVTALSVGLSAFSAVVQLYQSSVRAYDFYLSVKEFPSTYCELQLGLKIERQRLTLWARRTIHSQPKGSINPLAEDDVLWDLVRDILENMVRAFESGTQSMEKYEQSTPFSGRPTPRGKL